MKTKSTPVVTQVHALHEVLNYFAAGFEGATMLDAFVDTAKGKVVFILFKNKPAKGKGVPPGKFEARVNQ